MSDFVRRTLQLQIDSVVKVANFVRIASGATCTKGSLVLFAQTNTSTYAAGFVRVLLSTSEFGQLAVMQGLALTKVCTQHRWAEWRVAGEHHFGLIEKLLAPVIWTDLEHGRVRALIPSHYRSLNAAGFVCPARSSVFCV